MIISLEAVLPGGELEQIATYTSSCVPREGEFIRLSVNGDETCQDVQLRVRDVTYRVVDGQESVRTCILVGSHDDASRAYLKQFTS